ncbi:MAG: VOC family protein [Pseudolabrys sp.]|nr:VOC family protein [Pseudolabrys sp.]
MSAPKAVLSLVTLGVGDLARSIAFYERLDFRRRAVSAEGVGFFEAGAVTLAVYPAAELAKDAELVVGRATTAVSLAWNCASPDEVDAALALAAEAGAVIRRRGHKTSWGGYIGYFTDPDGHLWEIAHNPGFPLDGEGRLTVPD